MSSTCLDAAAPPAAPAGQVRAPAPILRRVLFFLPVLLTTFAGVAMMYDILQANGTTAPELAVLLLFTVTFGWIAVSFWTAMFGFALRLAGVDPLTLRRAPPLAAPGEGRLSKRTAVVMPVYNEEPARVLAGLEATWRSLAGTGDLEHFDFFLLSDTSDAKIAAAESRGCAALRLRLGAEGRLHYRRRERNLGRKAGNIAEFCCRWGRHYDFMVVLDADSIMAGTTLGALVRAMEATPRAGIIQTAPTPAGQETMFGRFVQFAARLYGPMLATGLSFWQGGEANYWGHNAIIRMAPFVQHCGLPVLPGDPPLGGEILSHDFVEAAFMRRRGWHVYLLPDLEGSYEGVPGNILDFAKRDRRWVQGNLQHLRLLSVRGLHPLNRVHFLFGALAYISSLLWLLLLALSTVDAFGRALWPHRFFAPGHQLFPDWPVSKPDEIASLLLVTLAMLALPKIAGVLLCLADRARRRAFGGGARVLASALAETGFSVLVAPLMMCFHAWFVVANLCGHNAVWGSQTRGERRIGAREATRYALAPTLLCAGWGAGTFALTPQFFWWLTPVLAGLGLAIPLVLWSSRVRAGRALERLGLFLTPEEISPPPELRAGRSPLEDLVVAVPAVSCPAAIVPPEAHSEMRPQDIERWWARRPKDAPRATRPVRWD